MTERPAASFLATAIDKSELTQREISKRAGFDKPNMISMMKLGETKVPIKRIPALAEACAEDAQDFLRIAMLEYHPETWGVLNAVFDPKLSDWQDPKRCVSREILKELKIRQKFG